MKRSDLFIRLMTGVIFLAVAVYGGVVLYDSVANPYQTTIAEAFIVEEVFKTQGYIVRSEIVLSDFSSAVLPIVREGEKVATGQAIAIEYFSTDALEAASEIRSLTMRISMLEAAGGISDNAGRAAIMTLSEAVHSEDFRQLSAAILDADTNILITETDIDVLRERLSALENRAVNARTIHAPIGGNFSQVVDGLENISIDTVNDILPSELHSIMRSPVTVSGAGKLITSFRWYYVAEMNYNDAISLSVGQTKTVSFSGAYQAGIEMTVDNIGRREGDYCVVIFSCDRSIHEVTALRSVRADVVNNVVTGIRVPKEAVHIEILGNEAIEYIYLQTSGYAERVVIERIPAGNPIETADSYLVRDGAESGSPLRVGSKIIIRANDLYHGKVVG